MAATARAFRIVGTVALLTAVALVVRSLRLTWQPLWWDEGYSIYFATEPLGRMFSLTAHDIHPPLYYTLLHSWIGIWGTAAPPVDRSLSVLFAALAFPALAWLAWILFPERRRLTIVAVLLLALNPMHLFYSQEIRMYGLAMTLGIATTACFWLLVRNVESASERPQWRWPLLGYIVFAVSGLYTLYYFALLLAGHLIWTLVHFRRRLRATARILIALAVIALAFLPWLIYAVPQLVSYVADKVVSDQDAPMSPLLYLERHLTAFTAGHLPLPFTPESEVRLTVTLLAMSLLVVGVLIARRRPENVQHGPASRFAVAALWTWLVTPVVLGWLINLRLPFFPQGGERLLLIALPYFVLLLSYAIDVTWSTWQLGKLSLGLLIATAIAGIVTFYTQPRYVADDYRPILGQIIQQGKDDDHILAIFPWQVGYWRAYFPQSDPLLAGPQPLLLSNTAVAWTPAVQQVVDRSLSDGTVWFPEPLTFGSSLPAEIETYLQAHASNLENRWYESTRLTAWANLPNAAQNPILADFGPVQLVAAGIEPGQATATNAPIAVTLRWRLNEPADLSVSLRLLDANGQVRASREYAAAWAPTAAVGAEITESIGLIVPVGLPPDTYDVAISLASQSEAGISGDALTVAGSDAVNARFGTLTVLAPATPQSPERLPIRTQLEKPAVQNGLALLGFTGPDENNPVLSGTELLVTLFLQNRATEAASRTLYVSLQDENGDGVAGYEGWPLSQYPTQAMDAGELLRVPVRFLVPGALSTGSYRLVAGFQDPETGEKSPPTLLGTIALRQRIGKFERPEPTQPLSPPAQFGTHARLIGFTMVPAGNGLTEVQLNWEVLQPLLPPHHIFVHADSPDGTTLAQQDGPPTTLTERAPSGTWQPGEFLTTVHSIRLPSGVEYALSVGFYDPDSGVRLPVTIEDQAAGDSVVLTRR